MRKCMMVLLVLCSLMITSVAMAMTQEQLDGRREYAEKKVSQTEEVTYDELLQNEKYYYKRFVKVVGVCTEYSEGKALLGQADRAIAVQIMTYRYKPGTEYTVVGQFAGMMPAITVDGVKTKWAVLVEDTHLPFMSEYGL